MECQPLLLRAHPEHTRASLHGPRWGGASQGRLPRWPLYQQLQTPTFRGWEAPWAEVALVPILGYLWEDYPLSTLLFSPVSWRCSWSKRQEGISKGHGKCLGCYGNVCCLCSDGFPGILMAQNRHIPLLYLSRVVKEFLPTSRAQGRQSMLIQALPWTDRGKQLHQGGKVTSEMRGGHEHTAFDV